MSGVSLEIRGLTVPRGRPGDPPILDDVSLSMAAGVRHGLIGASGSGKSTLLRAVLGRVPAACGAVRVGEWTVPAADRASSRMLARTVAWIPQDAAGSLDPCMTAREAVAEGLLLHGIASGREAGRVAAEHLERVGIPADAFDRRPGELSGGQSQRVAVARALATGPGLVLADEPTSALDPLLQARLLHLLFERCAASGATVLLVAHTLGIVRRFCDAVTVLQDGRIVETGATPDVLDRPAHPVTRALIAAELLPIPEGSLAAAHPPSPRGPVD
jgi:peptide/nickel transport system ATP-binding protein